MSFVLSVCRYFFFLLFLISIHAVLCSSLLHVVVCVYVVLQFVRYVVFVCYLCRYFVRSFFRSFVLAAVLYFGVFINL